MTLENDVSMFEEACKRFGELYDKAGFDNPITIQKEDEKYLHTATLAVAILYSLGRGRLSDLENKGIIHYPIKHGSLNSAYGTCYSYFIWGKSNKNFIKLDKDRLEQLIRTCRSAQKVVEKGLPWDIIVYNDGWY